LQHCAQADAFGGDLVAGGAFAGYGLECAEQFGGLAAEQLQVVAGDVCLIEMGGDVQQRPTEAAGNGAG
jgi:hypothetical protein